MNIIFILKNLQIIFKYCRIFLFYFKILNYELSQLNIMKFKLLFKIIAYFYVKFVLINFYKMHLKFLHQFKIN